MAATGTALSAIDDKAWDLACAREPVIRALAALPSLSPKAIEAARSELGLRRTQLFELVARYRHDPVTSSLVDHGKGFPKGRHRLAPEHDAIIAAEIERFYLKRPKPCLAQLVRDLKMACKEQGIPAPSRKAIATRLAEIDQRKLVASRDGQKAADDRFRPVKGSYRAEHPLQVVQMDHTLADIIIVDEAFRRPLCRPTLTLQVDIATRVIPGFYISLESPSATSAGLAIRHAVLPKAAWLADREVEIDYPICGIPDALHMDNAKEFHSHALERGCQQHGIGLLYRPMKTPHYGGHIERLIGTTIGEVHLLPGTTFSNVQAKGDYDAEAEACMTLTEFERWFALQVGIYHGSIHRELGVTPLSAWKEATAARQTRLPADTERFLLDFLPYEMRKIRREGIELFNIFYWHGALGTLAVNLDRKLPVKYNPLNLSAVYLEELDGSHLVVPMRDRRRPAITKFEHDMAVKALRELGRRSIDENTLFAMVKDQRRIVGEAVEKTKAARKSAQRIVYALDAGAPPAASRMIAASPAAEIDGPEEPVIPLKIEERP
ncbi:Integrase catalytic subunit [Sphingobium herbicidovorans NBRC 16415]|uniref:Integrase catalytic subunit n=1 Tax=Sphingobium herbicidovorans (strain ATCC 700291 / DSM 11019 / CCUG 56400 / KCTC 2939 / LMG 18315 / NBRC 16415 / MH) TaxID=1219045 RepID=A0A086P9M2_SPHHM|nr:Mu transposase C-terminal domain-containing protein [Sphingobium herbicidovorans]KFG90090.1 Integrase catalytic subunit [Sphingobium herbicidovorans NBRC 16415]